MLKKSMIFLPMNLKKQADFEQSFTVMVDDIDEELRKHEYLPKGECLAPYFEEKDVKHLWLALQNA